MIEFNKPNADDKTDVVYGFHPVGNTGHDIGPSLTTWQPLQRTFTMHLQHMFAFEYFAYTPIAEWGGKKLRIPIEDDAILMEHGIQFLHPANYRLLVIRLSFLLDIPFRRWHRRRQRSEKGTGAMDASSYAVVLRERLGNRRLRRAGRDDTGQSREPRDDRALRSAALGRVHGAAPGNRAEPLRRSASRCVKAMRRYGKR